MKKIVATAALALAVTGMAASTAAANTKRTCIRNSAVTLSVRGMQCGEGQATVSSVFEDPAVSAIGLNDKRTFRTKGWSGTSVKTHRTFVCSVLYTNGTGLNRGGFLLRVNCRDFNGDAVYFSEQQDGE